MALRESLGQDSPPADPDRSFGRIIPVKWWAGLGVAALLIQAAILVKWVFSPYFHRVDPGPTPLPDWMKIALIAFQVILPVAGVVIVWVTVVRPWRRERRLTVDGLLVLAFGTLWVQDPMSAYTGQWFTYNAWLFNMGSWTSSMPTWMSPATPDHQIAYPLLIVPGAYIAIFLLVAHLGTRLMTAIKRRRPQTGRVALISACYVFMAFFDFVFEGVVFMPLGAWEYPGGHWHIFDSTFHAYPLNEALATGAIFTSFACVKYFVDDRGFTLAERGSSELEVNTTRTWAIRALAVTGIIQVAMFLGYTVPGFVAGLHATEWNEDTTKRSYLTYVCGEFGPTDDPTNPAYVPCPPSAVK